MTWWDRWREDVIAFGLIFLFASAVWAAVFQVAFADPKPREYPGHKNTLEHAYQWEAIPDIRPWTWYDTVGAHNYCNVVYLDELHPTALSFLYMWHRGLLNDEQFMAAFGLPNSDYISAAECIVRQKHIVREWTPHA